MTTAQLRVRTGVRAVFWTTALLAAYVAAHVPAAMVDLLLP